MPPKRNEWRSTKHFAWVDEIGGSLIFHSQLADAWKIGKSQRVKHLSSGSFSRILKTSHPHLFFFSKKKPTFSKFLHHFSCPTQELQKTPKGKHDFSVSPKVRCRRPSMRDCKVGEVIEVVSGPSTYKNWMWGDYNYCTAPKKNMVRKRGCFLQDDFRYLGKIPKLSPPKNLIGKSYRILDAVMVHPCRLPVLTSVSFRIGSEPFGGSPGQLFWVKISLAFFCHI